MDHVGARVPETLKIKVGEIAHEETVPGHRNVKPSHVIRAALRMYVEEYDDLDQLAYDAGAPQLDPETTVSDGSSGQRFR